MGVFQFNIAEEYVNNPGDTDGKLGIVKDVDTGCLTEWSCAAKTQTGMWVEWTLSDASCSVARKDLSPTINGEQFGSGIVEYVVIIDAYRSFNEVQNNQISQVVFTLRASDGGAVLDSKTMTRSHSGVYC